MKLIKCYIENFGKFSKFKFDFADNLNVIKEENGWGKTTLATFIKAMFFGLPNATSKNKERTKYTPWQGGNFGGYLEFETNGKQYRVERSFGKTQAADEFTLFNATTNKVSKDFTANLGEELFKLDADCFERTLFLPQKVLDADKNESVSKKLTNLIHGTTQEFDYGTAQSNLDKRRKNLSNKNKTGEIEKLKEQVHDLACQINDLKSAAQNMQTWQNEVEDSNLKINDLTQTQNTIKNRIKDCSRIQEKIANQERYHELATRVDEIQTNLADKQKIFNGREVNQTQIESYLTLNKELQKLHNNFENNKKIISCLDSGNNPQTASTNKNNAMLLGLPLLMIALAILVLGIIVPSGIMIGLGVAVLVMAGGVIIYLRNTKKHNNATQQQTNQQNIQNLTQENATLTAKINTHESQIQGFLTAFQFADFIQSNEDKLFALKQALAEVDRLQDDLYHAQQKFAEFKQNKDFDHQENLHLEFDINALQQEEATLQAQIDELRETKSAKVTQINALQDRLSALDDLENAKANADEKLTARTAEFSAIKNAMQFLEEANQSLTAKFLDPMKNGLRKYLHLITNQDFANLQLDTDFNISFTENGKSRDTDYYSRGYQNTFALCMRLALIDAIFNQEKPFIILDDPFVNLDETKIKNALQFLRTLAQEHQLVYYTCHESRC